MERRDKVVKSRGLPAVVVLAAIVAAIVIVVAMQAELEEST